MKSLRTLVPLALLFVLLLGPAWSGQYVTILHFNDFHGHLLPSLDGSGQSVGGLARMATLVDRVRAANASRQVPTLLLQAGDVLQGTPLSMTFKGEPDFACLNAMGVGAMCLGNHEFDFGLDNLFTRIKQAKFPVGSTNVSCRGRMMARVPFELVPLGTETGVIIPLTTPETKIESAAKNVADVDFADPVQTVRDLLPQLPHAAKVIIVLSHQGLEADLALAQAVPQVDIIIGGHSHDALQEPRVVGKTLVCQAGAEGKYLGQLDAYLEDGDVTRSRGFLWKIDARLPARPDLARLIKGYDDKLQQTLREVVGETAVALIGDRDTIRTRETNLGNLVADAMRDFAGTTVAMTNAGGIRAGVDAGPITVGEVLTVLPFDNSLVTVELTGEQIQRVLQRMADLPSADGGFLQVSGLSFSVKGKRVEEVRVGGAPLEPSRTYSVATNDFLSTGGNGYRAFAEGKNPQNSGVLISEVFKRYLRTQGKVSPEVEGRIRLE